MDKVLFFFLVACALLIAAGLFAVLWWQARERAMRAELMLHRVLDDQAELTLGVRAVAAQDVAQVDARLQALAVDVDRLVHAQQHIAQQLAERSPLPELPRTAAYRPVTPH